MFTNIYSGGVAVAVPAILKYYNKITLTFSGHLYLQDNVSQYEFVWNFERPNQIVLKPKLTLWPQLNMWPQGGSKTTHWLTINILPSWHLLKKCYKRWLQPPFPKNHLDSAHGVAIYTVGHRRGSHSRNKRVIFPCRRKGIIFSQTLN